MGTGIALVHLMYLALLLLPLFLLFQLVVRKRKSPPRLPIIGHLHLLGRLPHRNLQSLSRKYGDMMPLQLGSKPALVVSSAEAASHVMKTHDLAFSSRPSWKFWTRILNNGKDLVSAPYGEYWRNMRSICVKELLSNTRVQSFRGVREEEVSLAVADIKSRVGTVVDMRQVFRSLANDVVSRVALGGKYKHQIDMQEVLKECVQLAWRFSVGDFVPCLAWIDTFTGASSRLEKVTGTLDRFFERVIAERSAPNTTQLGSATTTCFLDVLLQIHNRNVGRFALHRQDIKGLLLDMFAAGTGTSSTTMEWMMSEILMHPHVMEKLQQETRKAANGKQFITEDDVKNMVYLKAVMQETLRLHPPTPLTPRLCREDVCVNGKDIAAGTLVFINLWAIGQDPGHWEEPEKFIPERFLCSSSPGSKENDFKMIPFGYGRRACPAELFSKSVMELAMANLLLKFSWRFRYGAETKLIGMKECTGITTFRLAPLLAVAQLRDVL